MAQEPQGLTPIRAGNVHWAAHWRKLVETRQGTDRAAAPPSGSRWDARADRFARLTQGLDPATEPFVLAMKAAIRPTDSVLDVGAGAGRYSMALSPFAARLTAVEPSGGMRAAFEAEARARGLSNARLVEGSWEDAQVEPHDVVFVANVLYFVADAVAFIEKLDRAAIRACYIFHRVEEFAAALGAVGDEIRGKRPPEPGFIELYNLLFSMGIRPDATLVRPPFYPRYGSVEEAIAESRGFLGLAADDHSRDDSIRSSLAQVLIEQEGGFGFSRNPQMAIVSWTKPA